MAALGEERKLTCETLTPSDKSTYVNLVKLFSGLIIES